MNDSADLPPEPKKSSIFKFSIAELIVVISIISILVILMHPALNSPGHISRSPKIASLNNLRAIGLGVHNYGSTHTGQLPLGARTDQQGKPLHGWTTTILPYLDQAELAKQINYKKSWNDPENQHVFRTSLPLFINPYFDETTNSKGYALIHYTANSHLMGSNRAYSLTDISNADGLTDTILLGEIKANFPAWGFPSNFRDPAKGLDGGPDQFGSPNIGGDVNVVFADGRGMSLSKDIDPQVLKALSTPNGGEKISYMDY